MKKGFLVFAVILSSKIYAQTGIGTTTPVNKLQIEATTADPSSSGSSANGNLRLSGIGASHVFDFGLSSSSTYSWLQARSKSNYATLYNLAFNPNGGMVGIGTTSPFTTLTVGNAAGTIGGEIALNPTSTQYEGGQITFKKSLVGSTVDWTIDQYGSTSANARLRIFNGNSETNGMAILENGNVGIGSISPTARLNIVGGGVRIATGFGNATSRPAINTSTIGSYEIRGVGSTTGTTQTDGGDDGFLRLSAGGGTSANTQTSIDLSGFSTVADMSSNIVMRTAGTERLRIDANGKLGIGTSTPATALQIVNSNTLDIGNPASNTVPSIHLFNTNNASSTAHAMMNIQTNGTSSGKPYYSLDVAGAFGYSMGINNPTDQLILNTSWNFNTTAANNAIIINRTGRSRVMIPEQFGAVNTDWPIWGGGLATYDICAASIFASNYVTRSDIRLKNTIQTIAETDVFKYLKLRPVTFYWNQDKPRDPNLQYGLVAQEVESIFPAMVNTGTDSMQTKSVNYQALHALSLKVIQTQQAEIEDLKKKQSDLENRLLLLESKIK